MKIYSKLILKVGTVFLVYSVVCHAVETAFKNFPQNVKEKFIQKIIDEPKLQGHLHPETPGRNPLVLSRQLIGENLKLTKFSNRVTISKASKIDSPHIKFIKIKCKEKYECYFEYIYPIEGLKGFATLKAVDNDKIIIVKSKVIEN